MHVCDDHLNPVGYTFVDAMADQKVFLEQLAGELGKPARALLPRVTIGSLRFRLLRKMPSHDKLYLLGGEGRQRVITGSANLSLAALCGHQKELYVVFEGEEAYRAFDEYYARDAGEAASVSADYLAVRDPFQMVHSYRVLPRSRRLRCPACRCFQQEWRLSKIGPNCHLRA